MDWTGRGRSREASALWPRMSLPVINLDRIIDARQCVSVEWKTPSSAKLITFSHQRQYADHTAIFYT